VIVLGDAINLPKPDQASQTDFGRSGKAHFGPRPRKGATVEPIRPLLGGAWRANEKGRQANLAALPLLLELAYFTSTMLLSAFNELPSANVAL